MKIIHLTDTHLLDSSRANLYGLNPMYRLKKAIKSINRSHSDAACLVITGDLVNKPSSKAYRLLQDALMGSVPPVYLIVGNHDNRSCFGKYFPDFVKNGFVQYAKDIGGYRLLFLDTLVEGESYGMLCKERLEWLKKQLKNSREREILIFMHHHPIPSGLYEMDVHADFRSSSEFWDILQKCDNIKHISFGHLHRILHASRDGISMHSTRSTTFQVLYHPASKKEYLTNIEKATYAIIDIMKEGIVRVNHHEYLDEKHYYEDGSRTEL